MTDRDQMESVNVFRFMDLPGELRELIYHHLCVDLPPINTAAIANHYFIPSIAQISRAIREEAMAVFDRSRELQISLHTERNMMRGIAWLDAVGSQTIMPRVITFTGRPYKKWDFFCISIRCSKDEPQFRVENRTGELAHKSVKSIASDMERAMDNHLIKKASARHDGHRGELTAGEVKIILNGIVRKTSGLA